jgi:6-phosphogluconolactonase/glucosamine-6-phosphate isomerase/deaminase
MPVDDADLEAAADRYAAELPASFDLIHLGLGDDGHTASLVPRDPVLGVRERDVALTGTYRGHRRMTLTYPVLERAAAILWLVTGEGKADALEGLLSADPALPGANVRAADQLLICDLAAARGLAPSGNSS